MHEDLLSMEEIAKTLNNRTYTDYFRRLTLMAKSVFKWENLPNNIDEKWIEEYLFKEGECMFFEDTTLGFMVTKCTESGQLNFYNEPTKLTPNAVNYVNTQSYENGTECVLIKNNDDRVPTQPTVQLYAYRLAEIARTIDINIEAQKMPLIILCSEKQRFSLKQVIRQRKGNETVIYGDKNLDIDSIKTLDTDAPIVFDKLQLQKHAIWNECMTYLGINNANQDKKERLVDDEVQANNEQVMMNAQLMLKARQRACDEINRIFKTDIRVSLRMPQNPLEDSEDEVIEDVA